MKSLSKVWAICLAIVMGAATPASTTPPASQPSTKPAELMVYVTETGEKYHLAGCRYLEHSAKAMTLAAAKAAGYTPCTVCKPPK
jgi:hypothetical protein